MYILSAWEQWTGPAKAFYPAIGVSQTGMASIIGKAKKLRREGHFPGNTASAVALWRALIFLLSTVRTA